MSQSRSTPNHGRKAITSFHQLCQVVTSQLHWPPARAPEAFRRWVRIKRGAKSAWSRARKLKAALGDRSRKSSLSSQRTRGWEASTRSILCSSEARVDSLPVTQTYVIGGELTPL